MATGSEAPGAKPRAPMGKEEAETPISERVSASRDALQDAFEEVDESSESEDVDLELSKSKSRPSGVLELRPSAEVVELVDMSSDGREPSEAISGFDNDEPSENKMTAPERPARPSPPATSSA